MCSMAARDPLDVLLDRHRHVAQHRGRPRAGDHEQVREAGGGDAEVGLRAVGPLVLQLLAVAALDVDPVERARHGVEAGGEDDDVELELAVLGADARSA